MAVLTEVIGIFVKHFLPGIDLSRHEAHDFIR
jgi:hypothetical protein